MKTKSLFGFVSICLLGVLETSTVSAQTCANGEVTKFQFPLDGWQTSSNGYWSTYNNVDQNNPMQWHLGLDNSLPLPRVGMAVKAICSGVVKEATSHTGYAGIVIIECWTGTECVVAVQGHMYVNNTTFGGVEYKGLQVKANDNIQIGQIIGYMADSDSNGQGGVHTHVGIHKGSYAESGTWSCEGSPEWTYAGYAYSADSCIKDEWYDPDVFIPEHAVPTTCLAATTCTANNPLVCNGGLRNTCEPEYKVTCDLPNVVKPALGLSVPVFLEGEDIIVKGLYEYIEGACNFRVYVERDGIPLDRQCVSQIDTNCLNHKEGPWLFTNEPHTGYVFPVIQGAIQGNYRIDICAEGPNDNNRTREVCKQKSDFTQQVFVAPTNALNRPQVNSIPENRGDTFCAPPKYGYICKDYCIDKGLSPGQCLNGWECDCDGQCASKTFCRYNHRCNAGIKTVCTPGQCVMGMECDCSGNWLSRTHCTTGHLCHRLCQNYCKDYSLNAGQCSGTYECDCDGLCRTRTHCTKNNQCGKYCEYYCFDYGLGPNQCRNGWQCDQTGECMVKNYCL